ncbi:sensor histidine kinase [Novosphingobium piscinae]|uniref:histidine kinase n=1 Tax=Novosphingobium piscinae TaxID=1507448 RepID=A0A7X1FXM4_9SPHN|nr:HAMP domain-containing sensor histidine kinase [Novosphingobium piscinae]MBC2668901.1 HAMP domain-containing histidine kinase [Novosphingobium piscinae]
MNSRFASAIFRRTARPRRWSLDSILLFSRSDWATFSENRWVVFLLNWMTIFIFIRWSIDCLIAGTIAWRSYQYPVVFALFSSLFLVREWGRLRLVPVIMVALAVFLNVFVLGRTWVAGGDVFALTSRNLVFYAPPLAIANSVVFRPRLALLLNLLLTVLLARSAVLVLLSHEPIHDELRLLGQVVGVFGFSLWFSVALHFALSHYMHHRLELVEVHHLVAEMERNQRLNEENARIRDDLVRTQRVTMVDSMTSTMAHEVNQPISCANNYIQAARRWLSRSEPDVAEALVSLDGAQGEITRVGQRVMSVRRLMQRLSSEYTSIDLVELLHRVDGMVRRDLADQDIVLRLGLPDDVDEDHSIYGCEEELIQVLMNLTSNAVDALKPRATDRRIEITLAEVDLGEIEIAVADNGCGIAPADLGRVFDRLFSTKPGGSGLGLSLSRRIVANHGGTIAMEGVPGHGARVIMRFPRAEQRRSGWDKA